MRIFVASAYGYWKDFSPRDLFEHTTRDCQVGGGETAMIQIATELAALGHEVGLFYDIEEPMKYRGVDYIPTRLTMEMITSIEHDALIAWDVPQVFRFADRAQVHVLAFQLNDPQVGVLDWAIDLYMHPSEWHAKRTRADCPEVTADKQLVGYTNGVDLSRYNHQITRIPKRVIYSSSPDRGLHHLLRVWPRIAAREPEAELHVYYDINRWLANDLEAKQRGYQSVTSGRAALLRAFITNPPPRTFFHGGIGQHRLAEEQLKASVMAYPCDPVRPTEGFSMSILEGIVAGLHVVTTDADALGELWSTAPGVTILDLPVQDDVWVNTICDKLNAPIDGPRSNISKTWSTLAAAWDRSIKGCLAERTRSKL